MSIPVGPVHLINQQCSHLGCWIELGPIQRFPPNEQGQPDTTKPALDVGKIVICANCGEQRRVWASGLLERAQKAGAVTKN